MAKFNRNSGKTWSKSAVFELRNLARENTPTRVIGFILGRTTEAIRSQRKHFFKAEHS